MIHYRKSFIGLAARWKHRNTITVISPLICSDDGAAAPRPEGVGDGSCVPPTGSGDGCACRLDGTRAQGDAGARVGVARELPPQRDIGRSVSSFVCDPYQMPSVRRS